MGRNKKREIDDDEYSFPDDQAEKPPPEVEKEISGGVAVAAGKKGKKGGGGGGGRGQSVQEEGTPEGDAEDAVPVSFSGKKKPSKPKKCAGFSALSGFGEEDGNDGVDDPHAVDPVGVDDDDEVPATFSGKKKPSKQKKGAGGGAGFSALSTFGEEDGNDGEDAAPPVGVDGDDDEVPVIAFTGKKKSSKSKKSTGAFGALNSVDDEDGNDNGPVSKHGGSGGISKASPAEATLAVADTAKEDGEDEIAITFSGKKKPSKSKKSGAVLSAFGALNSFGDGDGDADEPGSPSRNSQATKFDNDNHVDDAKEMADLERSTLPKKQQPKKKKGGRTAKEEEELDKLLAEFGEAPTLPSVSSAVNDGRESAGLDKQLAELGEGPQSTAVSQPQHLAFAGEGNEQDAFGDGDGGEEEAVAKKQQKKKKKKGGKGGQVEEDVDKILAELNDDPVPVAPQEVKSSQDALPELAEDDDKDGEIEGVESAAAKKKKKKKEKEKEKKAAAAAAASTPVAASVEAKEEKVLDAKAKATDNKKLPKHVREMQEKLARMKEAEEKKKREEEERLRREEEERRKQEEEQQRLEELKRQKKEREKEKLLKKKMEGKILTAKQKEEQRRLEAMRKQFLSQSEVSVGDAAPEVKKKPKYEKKKAKHVPKVTEPGKMEENHQEVEFDQEHVEEDALVEGELEQQSSEHEDVIEDKQLLEEDAEMEEEDADDEWDAKSWDDIDVKLPSTNAFDEEDKEEEVKPPARTSVNSHITAVGASKPVVKKVVAPLPTTKRGVAASQENDSSKQELASSEAALEKKGKIESFKKHEASSSVEKLNTSGSDLRSPICCILGHVDTGKTKLLDCIRRTNVQEGEAGGITQQIGATYFPTEYIRERTKELKADAILNVPGLLVIDTPGHESFTNLRSRGSSLCDIAILVVDIMHGLEPQTIESISLLKRRETEFIVALNKVDRLYGWKTFPNAPFVTAIKQQPKDVQIEFNTRLTQIVTQLKEQGLNTALYYKNKDFRETKNKDSRDNTIGYGDNTFNIVPTSAISGEGIPDLLLVLVQWAQKTMVEKLTYVDEVQCTVLEVKVVEGFGTTIDVVLVNGVLHEGDQIVVCGMQGPIITTIRTLMTPAPMKELRIKSTYVHHKELKAAQGVKIAAQGLEHAIAGTALYVVGPDDDLDDIKKVVMQDMDKVMSRIDRSGEGVYVQASTLGSLEALTEFLKSPAVNIPFSDFSIGPVHKKDVMKASVMLEKKKEFATILAFDVKVMPDARELAEESNVKIFVADIIYHLFDQFKAYMDDLKEAKKKESADEAVFPCILKIMPNCVFNKKDPIVLGVDVIRGIAKVGTPICIPSRDFIDIGVITSIEFNHKPVPEAKKGQQVAIKIVSASPEEQQKMFGRHFDMADELVSHISRKSIDVLKANYRDEMTNDDWKLLIDLRNLFKIL